MKLYIAFLDVDIKDGTLLPVKPDLFLNLRCAVRGARQFRKGKTTTSMSVLIYDMLYGGGFDLSPS